YRIKHLVRDILALGDRLSPDRPFALVGHDWGGSVAYATAIAAPPASPSSRWSTACIPAPSNAP
ncbi:MAG: hypothetical protein WAN86_12180, partial [Hyphomicrobiaceae bacterium]